MMCGARHLQHDTSSVFIRGGMYRNGTYPIETSRERLRRFSTFGVVLICPELRRGRLEIHSELVQSGSFFASRPNDTTANAQPRFLTIDGKYCALWPIHGRQNQGSVKVDYGCHYFQRLAASMNYQRHLRQDARASSVFLGSGHFD
jgi:hypothetical protein